MYVSAFTRSMSPARIVGSRLPIQEVWQQLDAGHHNKSWKGDSIEGAKDDKETQHDAGGNG